MDKPNQLHFRVGISVGKKIGNAVHRNWVKRRIRQSLLELKPYLRQDVDFIVIARPAADQMAMADVKASLIHVLKLAKLIDPNYDSEEKKVEKENKEITSITIISKFDGSTFRM